MRLLLGGTQDGLMQVRRHLDAARGGLHLPPIPGEDAAPWTDAEIVIV